MSAATVLGVILSPAAMFVRTILMPSKVDPNGKSMQNYYKENIAHGRDIPLKIEKGENYDRLIIDRETFPADLPAGYGGDYSNFA
jgi:hypothetical protein